MAKKRAKSYHLAILALIMALGIATPSVLYIITVSNNALASSDTSAATQLAEETGDDDTTDTEDDLGEPAADEARPTTAAELQNALDSAAYTTITLTADITIDSNLTFDRAYTETPFVLDLNNHKITATHANARLLDVLKGNLKVTGGGSLVANAAGGVAIRVKGAATPQSTTYTKLTVDKGVILSATAGETSYGFIVSPVNNAAHGVEITFAGEISSYNGITVNGMIQNPESYPVITLTDDAVVRTASRSEYADRSAEGEGGAIYAAGYAKWNIGAALLVGDMGIGMKAGEFTFTGTKITARGLKPDTDPDTNNNGINNGGAVFQIEDNTNYARNIEITINGGTYSSVSGDIFYQYGEGNARARMARAAETGALNSLTINSGTFYAVDGGEIFNGIEPEVVTIQGGTFTGEMGDEYLAANPNLTFENGSWVLKNTSSNPGSSNPGNSDNDGDDTDGSDDQTPGTPNKPATPGSTSPDTAAPADVYSPRVISAVKSAAAAIIAGILVVLALCLYRFTSRHHLNEAPKPAGRGARGAAEAKKASSAKTAKATTKAAKSRTTAKATAARKTATRAKSAKTATKSRK